MGTSVTWHVVSVPTSPGTSRHPPRPIRLAPVPILWPRRPLSTISPFSALFTRCPVQGPMAVVRHHPTLNRTRRQYAGNFTEPLAHPHTLPAGGADNGRRWFPRGARGLIVLWLTSGCLIEVHAIGYYYRLQPESYDRDQFLIHRLILYDKNRNPIQLLFLWNHQGELI